ncbi:hypothetical protein RB195_011085 [Necator americanus]|uniref:Uncharacterized protein n=1 Tax=Necator americanus TaxID=51031 RepID=A0ABR1D1S8_NECAM
MKEARLRWFGHVLRREEDSVAKTALKLDVSGVRPRGRPKIRWLDRVKLDMIDARLCTADAMDRTKWKTRSRKVDPATTWDKEEEEEEEEGKSRDTGRRERWGLFI